jgi:hypothetical protein
VALGHFFADPPFDRVLGVTLGDRVGHRLFDFGDRFTLLGACGDALARRILEDQPLQRAEPVGQMVRTHHAQRVHLPGT